MPRRGENIYKRKDGRWEGRYAKTHLNGKTQYGYVYAKTYKLSEVLVPSQSITETMPNSNFESVALEWISNMRPQLKESSAVKYTNIINLHLLPNFGNRPIGGIMAISIHAP